MRLFRNAALLRRALGLAIIFALLGLLAGEWRRDVVEIGQVTYEQASRVVRLFWWLASIPMAYVAACLLLTPNPEKKPRADKADGVGRI